MRKIKSLLVATLLLFVARADQVIQIELELQHGTLRKISEQVITKKVKVSRGAQRGGRSGAASTWFWRLVSVEGEELVQKNIADPTILCTGDCANHVILDSTRFIIELPLIDVRGATLELFNKGGDATTLVGEVVEPVRSTPIYTETLKGGE